MRWKTARPLSRDEQYAPYTPWHWHFAWKPVTHQDTTYWLCWIPRRFERFEPIYGLGPCYIAEYACPEHSIAGNVLGQDEGRRHGPNRTDGLSWIERGMLTAIMLLAAISASCLIVAWW